MDAQHGALPVGLLLALTYLPFPSLLGIPKPSLLKTQLSEELTGFPTVTMGLIFQWVNVVNINTDGRKQWGCELHLNHAPH